MMMTWRRSEGKQEAREGEGIFQQEEAWMTIEQEVRSFILLYSDSFFTIQHCTCPLCSVMEVDVDTVFPLQGQRVISSSSV